MSDLLSRFPALAKIATDDDPKRDARINAAIERALALEIPKFNPKDDLTTAIAPLLGLC